ncbi:MAG: radical SAM protein [Candidatus Firestonebacteria bacterium]|nr:radical SAM protein [Candidatus Firestonebacteria bacterium]
MNAKKEILIVQPSFYLHNRINIVKRKTKICLTPPLISPYLASFFPDDECNITIKDEVIHNINFDKKYDLIAIPFVTPHAKRAYEIADIFRKKGSKVLMGGYHVTARQDEALQHCDSIVAGEFEPFKNEFIEDFFSNNLKPVYKSNKLCDMKNINFPRYDLVDLKKFSAPTHTKFPMETSRGCPFNCDFCCLKIIHGNQMRFRPVEEVIEHVSRVKIDFKRFKPRFFFIDENMVSFNERNVRLLELLMTQKIEWSTFFSVDSYKHPEFIELAARSGCVGATLGFGSLDKKNMEATNNKKNNLNNLYKVADVFKKNNIPVYACIMAGFPNDNINTLYDTLNYLIDMNIPFAFFYSVYPLPGTTLYDRYKNENLLLKEDFWLDVHNPYELVHLNNFNSSNLCFEAAFKDMVNKYYKLNEIFKRSITSKRFFRVLSENIGLKILNKDYDMFSTL